jgi:hypothetical protein
VVLALLGLYALGGSAPAWAISAGIAALAGVLCAAESLTGEPETAELVAGEPEAD